MNNLEPQHREKKITYNLPKTKESHSSFRENLDIDDRDVEVKIEAPVKKSKPKVDNETIDEILGKAKKVLSKVKHKVLKDGNADLKKYYFKCLEMPINENMIMYEAFAGLGILDNPRAIFKAMLKRAKRDPKFKNYIHVWSINDRTIMQENIDEFKNVRNVIIVDRESKAYYKYLATSKYLINNSTFGYYFAKREEQVYINTWHGIPTKYMGYEHVQERVENARGVIRNILNADYLLSANNFMVERMYKRAYLADGAFKGEYLDCGYPRYDAVTGTNYKYIVNKLRKAGIDTSKKIVLYAPTWKGALYNKLDYNMAEFKSIVRKLQRSVPNNYNVYLRVHYFIYKELKEDEEFKDILIPFTIDTNELLSIVDIMISDYSSIFFDFLRTGKPVIFYMPDLKEYESGRGLYVPIDTLPGAVCEDIEEAATTLEACINNLDMYNEYYEEKYLRMQWWCSRSCKDKVIETLLGNVEIPDKDTIKNEMYDCMNCDRLVERIWGRDKNVKPHHLTTKQDEEDRVLYYVDWEECSPRELEELKAAVDNIDYEKADVTILTKVFNDNIPIKQFFHRMIPRDVRILTYTKLPYRGDNTSQFIMYDIERTLGNERYNYIFDLSPLPEEWPKYAITKKNLGSDDDIGA